MNGPADLRQALLRYSDTFISNLTENLMTYATGRRMEYYDMAAMRKVRRDAAQHGNKFSAIILGIVKSAPFQMRTKVAENAN